MTFGDMARSLGLGVDGHVLYSNSDRQAQAPVERPEHRGAMWTVDWWLGREVNGARVVAGEQGTRTVTLYTKARGEYDVSLDTLNTDLYKGKVSLT